MNLIQRQQPALSWVQEIDRLLDRPPRPTPPTTRRHEVVSEEETQWVIQLVLPGFTKEDLQLRLSTDSLHLIAETPPDRPFGGRYERRWKLGTDLDGQATRAKLEHGILQLSIPKKPKDEPQPVIIPIE